MPDAFQSSERHIVRHLPCIGRVSTAHPPCIGRHWSGIGQTWVRRRSGVLANRAVTATVLWSGINTIHGVRGGCLWSCLRRLSQPPQAPTATTPQLCRTQPRRPTAPPAPAATVYPRAPGYRTGRLARRPPDTDHRDRPAGTAPAGPEHRF